MVSLDAEQGMTREGENVSKWMSKGYKLQVIGNGLDHVEKDLQRAGVGKLWVPGSY